MTNEPLPQLSAAMIQNRLPDLLLDALERRWFDDFDIDAHAIEPQAAGDLSADTRFLQVEEFAFAGDIGRSLHRSNMQNVLSSFRNGGHALAYSLHGSGAQMRMHMGLHRSTAADTIQTADYIDVLRRSLQSNFPGIVLSELPLADKSFREHVLNPITVGGYVACLTGIPSLKAGADEFFTQGLERLVDGLRGEQYALLVLAEPIGDQAIREALRQCRLAGQEIHALVRRTVADSQSSGSGSSTSQSASMSLSSSLSMILGVGLTRQLTDGFGSTESETRGLSVSRDVLNKTAELCEQTLDHYAQRLQRARSLGLWNTGIYLASADVNTFLRMQGLLRALFAGQDSYREPLRVLDLSSAPHEVQESLRALRIPALVESEQLAHPLGKSYLSLGTPLTTEEVSVLMGFPHREVPGLKVKAVADFNLNPPPVQGFELGNLLYRGEKLPERIRVSTRGLTRHTFVTGLTGSGKTNTCLALLANAYRAERLNFLVIDPAKTEYRLLLDAPELQRDLLVFTLGDETAPFRLNPFEFAPGFPLLTHVDLLKAVFNSAFPMYASMPYLLEEALLAVYAERGWDVTTSTNRFVEAHSATTDWSAYMPRLTDLFRQIDRVVADKRYGAQLTQDLTAALKARIGSLCRGAKGLMLDTARSTPFEPLLRRPVVLELRRIGDDDEKAFVMSLLFIRLYEACQSRPTGSQLQHLTLIEEAHRLLRNVSTNSSLESANPRGKAVEAFTDLMAEMRTFGEGFIIVDQMPGKLVPDVIKGTNLKIVHRLLAHDDRLAVGNAMGLSAEQIDFLPRLTLGQAVLHSEEVGAACLIQVDSVEDELVQQASGADSTKTSVPLLTRLAQHTLDFYSTCPQVLQRYASCRSCTTACLYRPEWDAALQPAAWRTTAFILALTAGRRSAIDVAWRAWRTELSVVLGRLYPQGHGAQHDRCARVTLANQSLERLFGAHSRSRNWQALLAVQQALVDVWEQWPAPATDLTRLRKLIAAQILTAPARPRPGCARCPTACLFGERFQASQHPAVSRLEAQLNAAPVGQSPSLDTLAETAVAAFGIDIDPRLRPAAAYCLLTQATTDERLLSAALHSMPRQKETHDGA